MFVKAFEFCWTSVLDGSGLGARQLDNFSQPFLIVSRQIGMVMISGTQCTHTGIMMSTTGPSSFHLNVYTGGVKLTNDYNRATGGLLECCRQMFPYILVSFPLLHVRTYTLRRARRDRSFT